MKTAFIVAKSQLCIPHSLYIRREISIDIVSTEKKPVVMFIPQYLQRGFGFLGFFYVVKKGITVEYLPMNVNDLKTTHASMPEEAITALKSLTDTALFSQKRELERVLKKSGSSQNLALLLDRKLLRSINDTFLGNIPYWKKLPWFHQTKDPIKKNIRKSPCSFQEAKVALKFRVENNEETGLSLDKYIQIGKVIYKLDEFKRSAFFLEYESQYFILVFNDYLTLESLDEMNIKKLAFAPKDFFQLVVRKLESKGYEVDRNGCFAAKEILSDPSYRILVSEISDTFLQFIPSFNYEGILIEGPYQEKIEVERQGELYRITRNKTSEQILINNIKEKHPSFATQFNNNFFVSFDIAKKNNWFLKTYQGWIDQGIEIFGLDLLEHFRYSSHKVATSIKWISSENSMSIIEVKVSFGNEVIRNKELQKIIQSNQKNILLEDNTIGVFPDEWLLQYSLILKHSKLIEHHQLLISNRLLQWLETAEAEQIQHQIITEEWIRKWKKWQNENEVVYPVPQTITATLRPYQTKGYEWMTLLAEIGAGACLADDMGLGKTLQTITFLAKQIEEFPKEKSLVICPASLIYNWKAEFEKFSPSIGISIFNGGVDEISEFMTSDQKILIARYGMVRSNIDLLETKSWGCIVVDESHNIKNITALITKAVLRLKSRAKIALSGTPVMNNTFDLYSQFEFLLPGFLGGQEFFRKEYAEPIDKDGNKTKSELLHRITKPYVMRRTKSQVAKDLPEKTVSTLWCEMDDKQRAVYQEVKTQIRNSVMLDIKNQGLNNSKIGILAGIMKLKQICCAPNLLDEYKSLQTVESIKLQLLIEELTNQLVKNKALVFSQFKGMLQLIAKELRHAGIPYYHFDGDTPLADRQEMVNAFNAEDDPARAFLISLKAGNTGLNLTAADYVFLVDPWWNTSVEDQAIDRTHRIGQTKHVMAYKMICKDSIEERIMRLQEKKGMISGTLVKSEEGFTKAFSDVEMNSFLVKSENNFVHDLSAEDVDFLFG